MPLRRKPLTSLTESDLLELIENGVAESTTIDYKRDTVGSKDRDRLNFLKDISAFINADGGDIVFGMEETEGVARKLTGVSVTDMDKEIRRLESMVVDGLRPTIYGIELRAIPLNGGAHAIVVRIPRSWSGPYMIIAQKENRFFVRRANGNDTMTLDELREGFLRGQEVADRLRRFHRRRLDALLDGAQDDVPIGVSSSGILVLHLIPFDAMNPGHIVDINNVHPRTDIFLPPLAACRT